MNKGYEFNFAVTPVASPENVDSQVGYRSKGFREEVLIDRQVEVEGALLVRSVPLDKAFGLTESRIGLLGEAEE